MGFMTNQSKADAYAAAYDRLEAGWTQGDMDDGFGNVCLVGAIDCSVRSRAELDELQLDVAHTLLQESRYARVFAHTAHRQLDWARKVEGHPLNSDGGIAFVEKWNDRKGRRKKRVLRLLAERRDHFRALAKDDRIRALELENTYLRAQLQTLLAETERLDIEVNLLKVEVGFWKGRALDKKRQEFAGVLSRTGDVLERQEEITQELWELRKPL
jgi:hypothetical protein